ncbi:MAG: poly-gamma-glutamate synthase PgsB [Deinococcota bacterium]
MAYIIALGLTSLLFIYWYVDYNAHLRRVRRIPLRIHVNGIRGKSTVTRLIAGILREAGYATLAKTTGSAARVIHGDGSETPITRYGAPTISEQINILRKHANPDLDALVIECMALDPEYQRISQQQIIEGNLSVITNVREDHQDVMGTSLAEIASSLSNTIAHHGTMITAESCPELQKILTQHADQLGSELIYADATTVSEDDLTRFDYLAFKENIATGLAVAAKLGISREIALAGMQRAQPDIGAVFLKEITVASTHMLWAPMFAVNDRESTVLGIEALSSHHSSEAVRVGILNNRLDRVVRAQQFAEIAALDLKLDYYITLGAFERQITNQLVALGYPLERIINLATSEVNAQHILTRVAALNPGGQVVLIGLVNIHTAHAEALIKYFEGVSTPQPKLTPRVTGTTLPGVQVARAASA